MQKMDIMRESEIVVPLINEAIEAALPQKYLRNVEIRDNRLFYDEYEINFKNIYLIAAGKAAISMVKAFENVKFSDRIIVGLEKDGFDDAIVSSHPYSNENGAIAARRILDLISRSGDDDLILFLLSGGASAILADYVIPVNLANSLFSDLMKMGADIYELNIVRKHLSFLKGGRMAMSTKSKIISLIVSDVMGDDLSTIGSGPTYFDNYTFNDAISIMEKYHLDSIYPQVMEILKNPERYGVRETPKRDEFPAHRVFNRIICNNAKALDVAENLAKSMGFRTKNLGTIVSGEAREISRKLYTEFSKLGDNTVMLSGGEPVVTVKGNGKGGRNQEFVLSLVESINENEIVASFGTDGIDGVTDAAGAVADYSVKMRARNIDIERFLENNDSYTFFRRMNTLIITGPTGTNVMDVQLFIRR